MCYFYPLDAAEAAITVVAGQRQYAFISAACLSGVSSCYVMATKPWFDVRAAFLQAQQQMLLEFAL